MRKVHFLISVLLSSVLYYSCATHKQVYSEKKVIANQYAMNASQADDTAILRMINPYKLAIDSKMNEVIGKTNENLTKARPESTLGNYLTDLLQVFVKEMGMQSDVCFLNYGGLRADVPAGNITVRNMFEVMPFENALTILTLNPNQFKLFLTSLAEGGGLPESGIRMKINNNHYQDVTINGQMYDSTKTYTLLTSDYIANGGDNYTYFREAAHKDLNIKVRDAFIEFLKNHTTNNPLKIGKDARISKME